MFFSAMASPAFDNGVNCEVVRNLFCKGEVKFGRNWMTTLGAVSKYCRDHANEKPLA
jgi:hypothetical protein